MTTLLFLPRGDHHTDFHDHTSLAFSMVLPLMYATLNNKILLPSFEVYINGTVLSVFFQWACGIPPCTCIC